MAHEKQGAGVAREHLLEEVERFEVEVVGGLVQHEKVGRTHQGTRDHQPATLAARQRLHRGARLLRFEQEILHVACDVARLPVDDHRVAAPASQRRGKRRLGVEALSPLVEGGDLKIGAEAHAPGIGVQARRSAD